jgi:dienelactone hydrolase
MSCCVLPLGWISMPPIAFAGDAQSEVTGLQRDVIFTEYSPLSRNTELAQRLLSPLYAARVHRELAQSAQTLREQPIDLAREHFAVYVPAEAPAHGYALLVFVPPWQEAIVPRPWITVLDRLGIIFATAAQSGNEENIFDRREPLALLAAYNIMHRYPVDPERVYIGGFSGGSRVALRIALGYPDVFHGALLMGGTDPIGDVQAPLPAPDLFRQFQNSTRLVYLTGAEDSLNLDKDVGSRLSLRQWCVFDVDTEAMPRQGHEVADANSLYQALKELANHEPDDPAKLVDCRARVDRELTVKFEQLAGVFASGRLQDASELLSKIDSRYGGLAAPQSIALLQQIDSRRDSSP